MEVAQSPVAVIITPNATIRALLEMVLEQEGFKAQFFGTPQEAMTLLRESVPRLLLLDEGITPDAFSVSGRLKMTRRLRDVPVLVLVSEHDDRTRVTAEISKVDHVIPKPFESRHLRSLLRSVLRSSTTHEAASG
ncbi:response regulator [Calidithermus chliarophilus]|uniref:response regulator n=1 Tax=Calidithermus chliarophilus TaxID=52023 RepID=UPI0003FC63EF|nr:response regulator [Calidithermus chliarophilus]